MKPFSALFLLGLASPWAFADKPAPEVPAAEFDRLFNEIKPQRGESPWREIPWLTDVTAARKKASAENKPMVIFTAADGSPLSRT